MNINIADEFEYKGFYIKVSETENKDGLLIIVKRNKYRWLMVMDNPALPLTYFRGILDLAISRVENEWKHLEKKEVNDEYK